MKRTRNQWRYCKANAKISFGLNKDLDGRFAITMLNTISLARINFTLSVTNPFVLWVVRILMEILRKMEAG